MDEKLMPRIDLTGYCKDKYIIDLGKYEIKEENGKTYAVRKFEYPNTYEECCNVLDYNLLGDTIIGYNANILRDFQKLLICRDAYWKIEGEQMGLGKPWKPSDTKDTYIIRRAGNEIVKGYNISCILVFPTAEMRDVFYENFKDLIEQCKELL